MSTILAPTPAPPEGTWRLAYLITGDRQLARDVVEQVWHDLAARGPVDAGLLHRVVAARARSAAARRRRAARGDVRHECLWTALQRLPRRDRAAIVVRL